VTAPTVSARGAAFVRPLAAVLLASTALRLAVAGGTGFGIDEAYAVTVARPASLSYFDHPPLHFWLAGAMTTLSRGVEPLPLRAPFVALFTVTLWAIARLTAALFTPRAGLFAAAALAASGVLGVTTGSWVLPDGPLVAAASVGAWLALPLVVAGPDTASARAAWGRWLGAGAAFAAAMLSKYHGALLAAGLGFALLTTGAGRAWLRRPQPWVAGLVACLGMLPALAWNARHGWVSFAFQGGRGLPVGFSLAPFAENVAGQAAWLLPWIAVPLALAFVRALRAGPREAAAWSCAMLAIVPVALFTLVTLGGRRGLPHWQAPGWLFAFPLLGAWADRALAAGARWPWRWLAASGALTAGLALLFVWHARTFGLARVLPALATHGDPALDALSWRPAVDSADLWMRRAGGEPAGLLLARNWMHAGKLGAAVAAEARAVGCACTDARHLAFRGVAPGDWDQAVLIERVETWNRGWRPAPEALGGDSLRFTPLGEVALAPFMRLAAWRVTRRGWAGAPTAW
jgi:4-amino-4-deoxy-L-arabinose transferase-like glycosyltransferase